MNKDMVKVPRELLTDAARLLSAHDGGGWSEEHFCAEEIRAILAQPVADGQAEQQPEQSGLNDDSKEAAMQKAFELGGLEDGSYHLESDELELVIRSALSTQGDE